MEETGPRESRKIRAAYAAIVPFVLAEVAILVVAYGGVEVGPEFFGLLLVANIIVATLVAVLVGSWRRHRKGASAQSAGPARAARSRR